jgi:hypothetical protein
MKYVSAGVRFTDLAGAGDVGASVIYGTGAPGVGLGLYCERTDIEVTMTLAHAGAFVEALEVAASAVSGGRPCDGARAITVRCAGDEGAEARATVSHDGLSVTAEIAIEGRWGHSLAVTMGEEEASAWAGMVEAAVAWGARHRARE